MAITQRSAIPAAESMKASLCSGVSDATFSLLARFPGFRVSGFRFQVLGFGLQISGSGFRIGVCGAMSSLLARFPGFRV